MQTTFDKVGVAMLLAAACSDSPNPAGTADGEGTGESMSTTAPAEETGPGTSTGAVTNSGSNSMSDSSPDTTAADSSDDGSGIKLDVAALPDVPEQPCVMNGGGNGGPAWSYLWASNAGQGTISKIDTETVTEVGRFITRPDGVGDPSRTSVSQSGHVAVANRSGGVTKIYADVSFCQDTNGTPGIQTSNSNAYLAWGEEECVAWHTPFNYESQRPVAWAQGTLNEATCTFVDERLWTAGRIGNQFDVLLLDGDTGAVIDSVSIAGLQNDFFGLYGGAVDGDGNFWASTLGSGNRLVRVDADTMDYEVWNTPVGPHWYGMTVDDQNQVWICSEQAGRFDYATETFMTASVGGYTGCMAERGDDGLLWMSTSGGGIIGVNRETLAVDASWPVPGSYGMSIDFYGYVWTVENGNAAHRVDPLTGAVTSYNGLTGAYTYSDMTGYALTNAGGGIPSG